MTVPTPLPLSVNSSPASVTEAGSIVKVPIGNFSVIEAVDVSTVRRATNRSVNSAPVSVIEPLSSWNPVGAAGNATSRNVGSVNSSRRSFAEVIPPAGATYAHDPGVKTSETLPGWKLPCSQ